MQSVALILTSLIPIWSIVAFRRGLFDESQPKMTQYLAPLSVALLATFAFSAIVMANPLPEFIWRITIANALLLGLVTYIANREQVPRRPVEAGNIVVIHKPGHSSTFGSFLVLFGVALALFTISMEKLRDGNPHRLNHGEVVDKSFNSAKDDYVCGNGGCNTPNFLSRDSWALHIQDCNRSEGCRTGWIGVSERIFSRYPIGSHYP